jgi:tRNA G18 (ribose-2'-O)-methylase SpoU
MNRKKGAKLKERTELLYGIQPVLGALQHSKRLLNQLYLKKDADSSERLR